jgi:phage recombination protein Bet
MSAPNNSLSSQLNDSDIRTLEQAGIIPAGTPAAQIAVFAHVAKERGLSPFSKEIYLVKYGNIFSPIVGINGLRKIAAQTGEYAGCEDVKYNLQPDGQYLTAAQILKANSSARPTTATVTVYRMIQGQRCPFTHTAVFSEFTGSGKWQTMPFQMIGKVAEAFAIRKAFSERVSGLDIEEERPAYEQGQIIQIDALEKNRNACYARLEQCRMDDRQDEKFSLKIAAATTREELAEIYTALADHLPKSDNPAHQNREFVKQHGQ